MNKVLQGGLLSLYRVVNATGVLNTSWGRRVFERAYFAYKNRLEASPVELLRKWVRPKTVVIDVGANVGFFTLQFAAWVTEGGWVIALEPEAVNYEGLRRAVARANLMAVVEAIQAAASDVTNTGFLQLNPAHPGDHRLGPTGVAVAMTTLDDLLGARGWPEVSLIKIDVQGAEARVLAGARQTLERFRPVLFIEVEDRKLAQYGSSASELLTFCTEGGYAIHAYGTGGMSAGLSVGQALALAETEGYTDVLMLPASAPVGEFCKSVVP
jgi:FkbM family methyltransferase